MASLPAKMRAILYGDGGKPTLREIAVPALASGCLVVKVEAASLNPVDYKLYQLTGFLAPFVLKGKGMATDFAGTVAAAHPESKFKVGERVYGYSKTGALADYCLAEEKTTAALPASVAAADAASMPVVALTALQQLHGFKAGESALVIGASGGVGSVAVQIAKALGASRVAAVCSASNAAFVKSLGADEVVDYAVGDEAMIAALSKKPFDRIVDAVTSPTDKDYWPISSAVVAPTGTTVAINGGIGMMTAMLYMFTGLQLQSPRARTIVCVPNAPELTQLVDWMAAGKLKAAIADTFPLDETAVTDGYARLEARRVKGKLVCKVA